MNFPNKPIIVFFRENSGNEPVKEWLEELTLEERAKIGKYVKMLEEKWPFVKPPLVKPLSNGVSELRIRLQNKIARILYVNQHNKIIFLHGFIKKTEKIPPREIELALSRLKRHIKGTK